MATEHESERTQPLGMAALFATILFSTATVLMLRVNSVEKESANNKIDLEKRIEAVEKSAAEQRGFLRKDLADHVAARGHASVLEELAGIDKGFVEVETQFRAAKEHQEQADKYMQDRLLKLEATDDRRGEEWLSRIVRLEERTDGHGRTKGEP